MNNLKSETIKILNSFNKNPEDIKWIGCKYFKIPINQFWKMADRYYDSGYGTQEVAEDLLIVGEDWWLERNEYDGSEWWEYKNYPKEPTKIQSVPTLFPINDFDYEYLSLKELENFDYSTYCELWK